MGRLFAVAFGVCLGALLPAALAAPDDAAPPPTRRYASGDEGHGVSVELPREWKVDRLEVGTFLMFLRLKSAANEDFFSIGVFRNAAVRNERGQVFGERGARAKQFRLDAVAEVHLDPMPHLAIDDVMDGTMMRHVWIYRVINRVGLGVNFACPLSMWPSVKDAAFRAAATMASDLEESPPRPAGCKASLRDGYEYLADPAVKDKDVDALHAAVMEQEKRYALLHGPVPKPASNPIVVVVAPDKLALGSIAVGLTCANGYAANYAEGRLFATPPKKDDALGRGDLADRLAVLFHMQSYGCGEPSWLCDGERRIAAMEAMIKKPLPAVPAEPLTEFATPLALFGDLVAKPPKNAVAQAASYVALLRAGPKPYREAFAAFLADVAATGDWDAAQKKLIAGLDQEKFRADAQTFVVKELKPVKSK